MQDCDIHLYADINVIEDKLNKDFNILCDWFVNNKLSIHFGEDKTKCIIVSPKNLSKSAEGLNIKRQDIKLKQYSTVEYLGCLLDSTLSGEEMALKVFKKVNGRLQFLYRQGKYLTPGLRRMICNVLIQPHFDYACSAWYPNLKKGLNKGKLQIAQNKYIRFCLSLGNRESVKYGHFKEINWLPVVNRVNQFMVVSVYKFFNDIAPAYMSEIHRTRNSEKKLIIQTKKHDYGKNCLSYMASTIWNRIDSKIKVATNTNYFKHMIKKSFLRILRTKETIFININFSNLTSNLFLSYGGPLHV